MGTDQLPVSRDYGLDDRYRGIFNGRRVLFTKATRLRPRERRLHLYEKSTAIGSKWRKDIYPGV
jgi:hypothetical protein